MSFFLSGLPDFSSEEIYSTPGCIPRFVCRGSGYYLADLSACTPFSMTREPRAVHRKVFGGCKDTPLGWTKAADGRGHLCWRATDSANCHPGGTQANSATCSGIVLVNASAWSVSITGDRGRASRRWPDTNPRHAVMQALMRPASEYIGGSTGSIRSSATASALRQHHRLVVPCGRDPLPRAAIRLSPLARKRCLT